MTTTETYTPKKPKTLTKSQIDDIIVKIKTKNEAICLLLINNEDKKANEILKQVTKLEKFL